MIMYYDFAARNHFKKSRKPTSRFTGGNQIGTDTMVCGGSVTGTGNSKWVHDMTAHAYAQQFNQTTHFKECVSICISFTSFRLTRRRIFATLALFEDAAHYAEIGLALMLIYEAERDASAHKSRETNVENGTNWHCSYRLDT